MKPITRILIPALILALYVQQASAQQPFRVKTSAITINGTSTLHEWQSNVQKVDFKGFLTLADHALTSIRDVAVVIPVTSIKSPKGKLMDGKTYDAFQYEKHPSIIFIASDVRIIESKNTLIAPGTLTMAGTSRPVELTLKYTVSATGEVHITGTKNLNMVEFKMNPPTAMMGTIQVGDEVVVNIDLTLTPSTALTKQDQ
jgi:polyisoprenoid-binding protein YceI